MIDLWATKWDISYQALNDLKVMMGINTDPEVTNDPPKSESAIQSNERLKASSDGGRLWRNNTGVHTIYDGNGQPVRYIRYGLCNDSKQLNQRLKACDLIGIQPVLITPTMVGHYIGQFKARECKPEGWVYSDNEHEQAQCRFIELVLSLGGDARFVSKR